MQDGASTPDRGHLITERENAASVELDRLETLEAVRLVNSQDRAVCDAIEQAEDSIRDAVDLVAARLRGGGRLVYVGAGTSGRLGVLDASECPPTFQSSPDQIQAVIAGGHAAMTDAVEGAEDDRNAGAAAMDERGIAAQDVVLGMSAGGTTPFVHAALERASELGAATIFLACVPASQVADRADVSIRLLTGPELLTGSTRLKAGTATKQVLNTITTLAMVRLGKVHGNLMVDVTTGVNAKLVDRGLRLVQRLTGVEREEAARLLGATDGQVKLAAVLHAVGGQDVELARERLEKAGGHLRGALE